MVVAAPGLTCGGDGAHELITIQAGHDLAGVVRLIVEPDNPQDASETANLHARIRSLAESHQILNPTADLEVAIRGEADAS